MYVAALFTAAALAAVAGPGVLPGAAPGGRVWRSPRGEAGSTVHADAPSAFIWAAAATYVEESIEALVGMAPWLVLSESWRLRCAVEAQTLDVPSTAGRTNLKGGRRQRGVRSPQ